MKRLILIKALLCLYIALNGQTYLVNPHKNKVIALAGLNLRAQPALQGKVLTTIPFADSVLIMDSISNRIDTIGNYKYYYEDHFYNQKIVGHWLKVKYKRYIGFVFDPYLGWLHNYRIRKDVNTNFGLNFTGCSCYENIHKNNALNWYGLYKDGEQFKLKKTKLSYFIPYFGPNSEVGWCTYAEENKHLLFLVGSKTPLANRKIVGVHKPFYPIQDPFLFHKAFEKYEVQIKGYNLWYNRKTRQLTLKEGEQEQVLNLPEFQLSMPSSIVWKGDLDGDQKDDYIIHYGEKNAQTVLYLSKAARKGELVKMVAIFSSGYCC